MADDTGQAGEEPVFNLSLDAAAGEMSAISPLVRRIICDNPSAFTYKGTCSYIVGRGDVAIIDPGPVDAAHLARLLEAVRGESVSHIVVTHSHRDHAPGVATLKAATGAKVVGCGPHRPARHPAADEEARLDASHDLTYMPDAEMTDGDVLDLKNCRLEAVFTPGHAMNHLAFALPEENILFSGDHVMGWSTTIVAPPDGSMRAYMESLEKLKSRSEALYLPGHGGPVTEPQRFVRALIHHRRQRETSILNRLAEGPATVAMIVERIYRGLDPRLTGAAGLSTFAHIEDLFSRGIVTTEGEPLLGSQYRLS